MENCPIELLIEFDRKEDEIYIQKNVSSVVDGFIARIGRPNFKSDFIGIASGTKNEVDGDKFGFFLEDFMKYYVIHANKKKAKKNEFDYQLINTNSNFSKNHLQDYMKVYLV